MSGLLTPKALKDLQGEGVVALKNVLLDYYYTKHRGKAEMEEEEKKFEKSSIAQSHNH